MGHGIDGRPMDLNIAKVGYTTTYSRLDYDDTKPDVMLASEALGRDIYPGSDQMVV